LKEPTVERKLLPLTHLRNVEDVRVGALTFRERIEMLTADAEGTLYILPNVVLHDLPRSGVIAVGGRPVAVWTEEADVARRILLEGDSYDGREVEGHLVERPWDIPHLLEDVIPEDIELILRARSEEFYRLNDVFIHRSTSLRLVEMEGPGLIEAQVRISPFVVLQGPFYVGAGSLIKSFSHISASSLGPVCKVAGEISHTVLHGYTNKQHAGFVGHSYLGEWVNVGAGTEVSNLKNTYGKVRAYSYHEGDVVDTGRLFVGTFVGDHAKLGINTTVSTGTVVGIFANITAADSPTPKFVPDFYWTGGGRMDLSKALEVARRVMARRGITPTRDYLKRIEAVYRKTVESER